MKAAYYKMHLAILLWGFTGLFGKLISLNEGMLVWYRLLISTVAIAIILSYRKSFPKLTLRETTNPLADQGLQPQGDLPIAPLTPAQPPTVVVCTNRFPAPSPPGYH